MTMETVSSWNIQRSYVNLHLLADEALFAFTKTLSPAAIDLELRSLDTLETLRLFIHALVQRLLSHRDFEAVLTLQNVFLRMHTDAILENPELQADLTKLKDIQQKESKSVLELIASSLGTLAFVRETL
jgi:U3 small nucleolar RNA-associated protein 21